MLAAIMKFRFVLLQPDDDPDGHPPAQEDTSVTPIPSWTLRYEQRGAGIVRVERLKDGRWKSTPIANFTARVVTDIIQDDGDEESRYFGLEVELG